MKSLDITIRRITDSDNLAKIAASVKGKEWGNDNELEDFREDALRESVKNPDHIQLMAFQQNKIVGMAYAMKIPSQDGSHWLYVDQVDVHPEHRRQGIARQLMNELFGYAKKWKLSEVWLGTELDNESAKQLYASLKPAKVETFVGYTFTIDT